MDFFAAQDHARKQTKKLIVYFVLAVVCIIASIYLLCAFAIGQLGGMQVSGSTYSYNTQADSRAVGQPSSAPAYRSSAPRDSGYAQNSYRQGSGYGSSQGDADELPRTVVWWDPALFALVSGVVLLVILGASAMKSLQLRSGGGAVARSLGGTLVDPATRDPDERRLVNVVQEMALASGTPVPEIYILKDEEGINAFAAGHNPQDAAVAVTRGCLKALNRDELQGVIAHEFSHILNGDMRLNLRLIGVLFGILVLTVIGEGILRSAYLAGGNRRSNRDSGNGAIVFLLIGMGVMVIGYIGVFFGRLIQSAISRQRGYMADASAVQFTRYPDGIANALIKIGAEGSALNSQHAQETAHLFFANGLKRNFGGGFATHPPLTERIRAIKRDWDGKFVAGGSAPATAGASGNASAAKAQSKTGKAANSSGAPAAAAGNSGSGHFAQGRGISPEQMMAAVGTFAIGHIAQAQAIHAKAQGILGEAATDPQEAMALLYALMLCEDDTATRAAHLQWLKGVVSAEVFSRIAPACERLGDAVATELVLPLVELATPALASLDAGQLQAFANQLEQMAQRDSRLTFGELAILALVRRKVARKAGDQQRTTGDAAQLAGPFALLLSAVITADCGTDQSKAQAAFTAAVAKAPLFSGLVDFHAKTENAQLLDALDALRGAAFALKKQMLAALAQAVSHDGKISPREGEWLRFVAATLDCPMPPLAQA